MKCIVLAKMSRRIWAAIIDFIITFGITLAIFFAAVLPACLNVDEYNKNESALNSIKEISGLYVKTETNAGTTYDLILDVVSSKLSSNLDENAINYLNAYTIDGVTYSVIDSLVKFYTEPAKVDDKYIFVEDPYEFSTVAKNLFKVGSDISNIGTLTVNPETNLYEIRVIDLKQRNKTFDFIAQLIKPDSYEDTTSASELVTQCSLYLSYENKNKDMMLFAIVMIIPVLFGVSFIFYFIIPICSKNGETIGKYILGLGVLSANGYVLKKYYHIPRYFGFFILEMAGGICSFGGLFLVSYLMFCFTKKRRCIHDFIGNCVVIDKKASVWFYDKDQEYAYNYKTKVE